MTTPLDDVLARLTRLPAEEQEIVKETADVVTEGMKWIPNPGPQTDAYFSKADVLLYGGQGGGGKALALNTPIPTPQGWTTMGELSIGDEVFDDEGIRCRVTACSPVMIGRPCYQVIFSDGTEIVADGDHRWLTMTQKERDAALCLTDEWRARRRANRPSRAKANSKKPWLKEVTTRLNQEREYTYREPPTGTVRTTDEIMATLTHGRRGGLNHSITVCAPVQYEKAELPIDPYVLGAWLGDGSSSKGEITSADHEVIEFIHEAGFDTRARTEITYGIYGLLRPLRSLAVLRNKHIPDRYLTASVQQRIALLQGLMDTDGYACPVKGICEFTTTTYELAIGAHELVSSLGVKCSIGIGRATLNGKDCGPKYRIQFMASFPAFRLDRKLANQKRDGFRPTVGRRYITNVRPVSSVPVKCIAVDSPRHLYLASKSFVPTHNTDLGLGLAFTQYTRSMIIRRQYTNLTGIIDRAVKINGTRKGFNGSPPPSLRTDDGRLIQFAANQRLGDERDWQGIPFGFKYFDEATQLLEMQIRFHLGWIRDAEEGQRTRAVLGTNPPVDADGDWIIGMFRPWLDLVHPKPAKHGELRWYITVPGTELGKVEDIEINPRDLGRDDYGRRPVQRDGQIFYAKSRTFIPAALADNPFLINTNYQAELDALPEPIRSAVRDGNFMAARSDADWQVIPTQWVIDAQSRWRPDGGQGFHMTAMGFDPAGGGKDSAVLAWRYGPWFADVVSAQGEETADGSHSVAMIAKHRRDNAPVVVDLGGGYGGAVTLRLRDNDIPYQGFNGASRTGEKTADRQLEFHNLRAEAWWRLREALDPDQEFGSPIALPPDPELRADLTAPTYEIGPHGIKLEEKTKLRKRLGRSPDKGDAVVMAWASGQEVVKRNVRRASSSTNRSAYQNTGYADIKKKRRTNRRR